MSHTKTEWRRVLIDARCALPPALRRSRSATIAERVRALPAFAACRTLLAYEPIGAEVDPTELASMAAAHGRPVYVPSADQRTRWRRWSHGGDRPDSAPAASPTTNGSPVLVLVPGLGFDVAGTRLGRGAGFYDRALAELRAECALVAVGLAFEAQIVPDLPADPWDQPVDFIATEARVIVPTGGAFARHGRDVKEVSNS